MVKINLRSGILGVAFWGLVCGAAYGGTHDETPLEKSVRQRYEAQSVNITTEGARLVGPHVVANNVTNFHTMTPGELQGLLAEVTGGENLDINLNNPGNAN